ncbi:MAG TPA: ABC transporter ATP-binding protein [Candidatus Dormibacteraeota bacterium]|nr:ABC transporter ATP-binding protein [Candidatus Dormibacteraeota bacterium]
MSERRGEGQLGDPAEVVLEAAGIHKGYAISRSPREVVRGVSLTVRKGEFLAVMGPSGCGKSTLLHVLGGLASPDQGTVSLQGTDLYSLSDRDLAAFRRRNIGFIFQFFNLLPSLTAAENVMLPYRLERERVWPLRGLGRDRDAKARADALMAMLGLRGLQGHRPDEIAGGEQQRVAVARALVTDPAILLADEPTGTLDYHAGRSVLELLLRLTRRDGRTIVLVTHDVRTAAYADRVAIMLDGEFKETVQLGRRNVHDTAPLLERLAAHGL